MSIGSVHDNDKHESGVAALVARLNEAEISHTVIEHRETFTATAEARAAHATPAEMAKTIVLDAPGGHLLAVIPASERLDLRKLRSLLDAGGDLRLASEREIADDFPQFELGAVPPLGSGVPGPEVVDRRLLDAERILCSGGDHRHAVVLDPRDLVQATAATVADISED